MGKRTNIRREALEALEAGRSGKGRWGRKMDSNAVGSAPDEFPEHGDRDLWYGRLVQGTNRAGKGKSGNDVEPLFTNLGAGGREMVDALMDYAKRRGERYGSR